MNWVFGMNRSALVRPAKTLYKSLCVANSYRRFRITELIDKVCDRSSRRRRRTNTKAPKGEGIKVKRGSGILADRSGLVTVLEIKAAGVQISCASRYSVR